MPGRPSGLARTCVTLDAMSTMPTHMKFVAAALIAVAVIVLVLSLNQIVPHGVPSPAQAPEAPISSVSSSSSSSPAPSASA